MFSFIFWGSLAVSAQTVLLPAPGAPLREYHARLRATTEYVSPIEAYLRHHPTSAHRDLLLARFAEAQTAFTERPVEEARARLRELVALLEEDDWGANEREIFLTGFVRLAQLEPEGADGWLSRALTLGPGLVIDQSLFPPPLIARLEKLRAAAPRVKPKFGAFDEVLVNGVSCRRERCPEVASTPHPVRVTYLSETFAPVTVRVPLAQLDPARLETRAFVAGTCAAPEFRAPASEFPNKIAFYDLECGKEVALRPRFEPTSKFALPPPTPAPPAPRRFYHSPWFWAGAVGVITTAIVLSQPRGGGGGDSAGSAPPPTVVYEPSVTRAN